MYCVGLTGGIGSGKSTVTDLFAGCGAAIVDTDIISRSLTAARGEAIPQIEAAFGEAYVAPDGSLDRAAMRALVFGDARAKAKLESILHPLIRDTSRRALQTVRAPYAILVVPLLLETGSYKDIIRRVVVVDCDESLQIARVKARSALSDDEVRAIIAAQMPRRERLAHADDVILNDMDIGRLRPQVEELHRRYLDLAQAHARGTS